MTPKERFQRLRRKGYCFQCLFPGASESIGKHGDGKCQGYLSCKHILHNKYPAKNMFWYIVSTEETQKMKSFH